MQATPRLCANAFAESVSAFTDGLQKKEERESKTGLIFETELIFANKVAVSIQMA